MRTRRTEVSFGHGDPVSIPPGLPVAIKRQDPDTATAMKRRGWVGPVYAVVALPKSEEGSRLHDAWRDEYLILDDSQVEAGLPDTIGTRIFLFLLPFAIAFVVWKALGGGKSFNEVAAALAAFGYGHWLAEAITPPNSRDGH